MASFNFRSNYICWRTSACGEALYALKQPNIIVQWELDTGNVDSKQISQIFKGFQKHSDWNNTTIIKQEREETKKLKDDENPWLLTELQKKHIQNPELSLFMHVELTDEGKVIEHARFLYQAGLTQKLYASGNLLLITDVDATKFFRLEGDTIYKELQQINSFYETQLKMQQPIYFSPDFLHCVYIDEKSNLIAIKDTLTDKVQVTIDVVTKLMF
jgi:hypothetical protein